MSLKNFDRQYRFIAAPKGQSGFTVGDGDIPIHISFSIQKNEKEENNSAKVLLWNLSPEHITILQRKDCYIALNAGYNNRMPLVLTGNVTFCTTEKDGADRKVQLEVVDSKVETRDSYVSVTYTGQINTKTILQDTADKMGMAVAFSHDATFMDVSNGFSYVGLAKNLLTKACDCSGLTWSAQNGVLHIKRKGGTISNQVYVLSSDTGMIGEPKRVKVSSTEGEDSEELGWDVDYFMNTAINVDDYVNLQSKKATGFFRVSSISIDGDNVEGDWKCTARLLEVK